MDDGVGVIIIVGTNGYMAGPEDLLILENVPDDAGLIVQTYPKLAQIVDVLPILIRDLLGDLALPLEGPDLPDGF